jgi:signal transduction histidine kinase
LSNEIRIPITSINGYLYLINQQKTKPIGVKKFSTLASKSTSHILVKVNDFLRSIYIPNNKLKINQQEKELGLFFDQILTSFIGYASLKNIELHFA